MGEAHRHGRVGSSALNCKGTKRRVHMFSEAALVLHNRRLFPGAWPKAGLSQLPSAFLHRRLLRTATRQWPETEVSIPALVRMATERAWVLYAFPHLPEVLSGLCTGRSRALPLQSGVGHQLPYSSLSSLASSRMHAS